MAKVSIIIPAYNCEKYLARCLGNVVNQTLEDIEVIIVNDASTDNTWKIISDCEEQFSDKVIAINSEINRGAGGARQIGLMYASGEYLGFVDSDDLADIWMYEKLYKKSQEADYDIVDCGFYDEAKNLSIIYTSDQLAGILNSGKRSELIVSGGYIWTKIFRREYLMNSGITFRENVILEDCEYLMYLFATARNIGNVKEVLYKYCDNLGSSSKVMEPEKYYQNTTQAIDAIYNRLNSLPNYQELKIAIEYGIIQIGIFAINMSLSYGKSLKGYKSDEKIELIRQKLQKYITVPLNKNKYVQNKVEQADLNILKQVMGW